MRRAFISAGRRRPRPCVPALWSRHCAREALLSSSRTKSTAVNGFPTSASRSGYGLDADSQPVTVTFIDPNVQPPHNRQTVQVPVGCTVVDAAKAHGVNIHAACGQKLQCATCHVILPKQHYANLDAPGVREEDLLESTFTLTDTSRLGCQVRLTRELDGIELRLPSADAKGLTRMSLDQQRPKIERQWTAQPASMPSFKKRASGVVAGVTQLAPDRDSAALTDLRVLERDLEDQRALTARLESELRQIRAKSKKANVATNEESEDTGEGDDDTSLAKVKAQLKHTRVDVSKMGRKVGFPDVIGLETAKMVLSEALIWPAVACPSLFTGVRGSPKGILLYGPPGCGKTMLARSVAVELQENVNFFHVRPGDIMSKFYGDSQRRVQALEALVKEHAPAVVFLDEVDTLLGSRDAGGVAEHHRATTNALLEWMDGFGTGDERVFFLGATNRPESIDEAALRRFGEAAEVGKPSEEARLALLKHLVLHKAAHDGHRASLNEADLALVARHTEGFSLADVDRLVKRAFLEVLRTMPGGVQPGMRPSDVPPVTTQHFETVIADSESSSALRDLLKDKKQKRLQL